MRRELRYNDLRFAAKWAPFVALSGPLTCFRPDSSAQKAHILRLSLPYNLDLFTFLRWKCFSESRD